MVTVKSVLLVIVNFNHHIEIEQVLARVKSLVSRVDFRLDPIVIDDHSTDGSPELAMRAGFRVIRHSRNSGVGAAIRTGITYGFEHKYDAVVILSANGKMQPEDIPTVLAPLLSGDADYVQGSRFLAGGKSEGLSLFRTAAIPLFSIFTSVLLGKRFSDITCGFRAYKLEWLKDSRINLKQAWLDKYELEFYIHYFACRMGLRIKEVPVFIRYSHLDQKRKSYIKPFTGWWSMIRPFLYLTLGIRS